MEKAFKTLHLYPLDYPFETLVQRMISEPPKLILDPDFQRKYKWDKEGNWERASKFIESCLMRIPLPTCYFAEVEGGKYIVIDGVQRLTTIQKFFQDEFALDGLTTFTELNGKTFSEIGDDLQNDLEDTTIRCIILRKENPKSLIVEIFARLNNQGAVTLTDQEIRHAVFSGPFNDLLEELAKNEIIKNFGLGKAGKKKKNGLEGEEQVLRFFAFQEKSSSYQGKLTKFLNEYMDANQEAKVEKIKKLRRLFNDSLEKCQIVFEDEVFTDLNKQQGKQSVVHYDLLMNGFSKLEKSFVKKNKKKLKKKFQELCKMPEFQKTLSGGLQTKSSISKRKKLWEARIKEVQNA